MFLGIGVRLGALGGFSPLSLFAANEDGAWYEPSDLSTLFQDSAGTTPVTTAGQPVGLTLDKTDNTYNALQATSAARPTYVVASNGDSVLQNDEIDDALVVTFPNMGAACTVAFVTQGSVYLEEDITLNGAYTLPQRDILGFVAIDRALTLVEKIQLIRYLASKAQGVNYGVDLGAMALAAISAVDVFVYDTTKDTDGGDWINNTDGLGPELVTNVDFATDSDWTKGTGWTIGGGGATKGTADNTSLYQTVTTQVGETYSVTFDVTASSGSAGVKPIIAGVTFAFYNTVGTHTVSFTAVDTTTIVYFNGGSFNGGSIDNISVKEADYSWYWETLNTATRGASRAFPAQAMIIAEAAKVTIYDATDPDLPMWMVFNRSAGNPLYFDASATISSLSMINGLMMVGQADSAGVLSYFSMLADRAYLKVNSAPVYNDVTIANRNRGGTLTTYSTDSGAIVNRIVNDVAMTVLADAPIDAATGLQVPTIAVGTNGGTSVINNDGTVSDSASTVGFSNVSFDIFGGLYGTRNALTAVMIYSTSADYESGDGFGDVIGSGNAGTEEIDLRAAATGGNVLEAFTDGLALGGEAVSGASIACLMLHAPNTTDFTKGMSALITSTYNTGWMHGDIKGAWLSSTDDTDLVGTELVTNGVFATDTDWTKEGGWTISGGEAVAASAASNNLYQSVSGLVVGESYVVSVDILTRSAGSLAIRTSQGINSYTSSTGTLSATVVATSTSWGLVGVISSSFSGTIDNISVRLADPDRSVNGNGLATYGTVTKTAVATGAELMAYSGFSASNSLEQPYNSDLDFGTGDFHVMGWVKLSSNGWVVTRFDGSGYGLGIFGTATSIIFKIGASGSVNDLAATVSSGVWFFATILRSSGVLSMYVNGASVDSASNTQTVNGDGDAVLDVGSFSGSSFSGSLALLRIGAGAPTAAQILKAYNDELPLFQENGAATIFGASNAVTALAHDPDTDLLHVGTSAGRSVFRGLERINNTSTSISTAISASGGLIVEK
jgi:hypothetical protein